MRSVKIDRIAPERSIREPDAYLRPALSNPSYNSDVSQVAAGDALCADLNLLRRAGRNDLPAVPSAARTHIHDIVRVPDDVKVMAESVLAHRLILSPKGKSQHGDSRSVIADVLAAVPVPMETGR